ncbi:hypothetical protein DFP78_105152 [Photobacterium lutimaris]|nr:hypothetical protein DFP78_105152 [Photobacterium lutimaris]
MKTISDAIFVALLIFRDDWLYVEIKAVMVCVWSKGKSGGYKD